MFSNIELGYDLKRMMLIHLRNFIGMLKELLSEKGDITLSEAIQLLEQRVRELE